MGDVGVTTRPPQAAPKSRGRLLAHLLLLVGAALLVVGVLLLAGIAWALVVAGSFLALYGLLAVDVAPRVVLPRIGR